MFPVVAPVAGHVSEAARSVQQKDLPGDRRPRRIQSQQQFDPGIRDDQFFKRLRNQIRRERFIRGTFEAIFDQGPRSSYR